MKLCFDQPAVTEWVRQRVPMVSSFGPSTAIGLMDANEQPLAGAVYHEYRPDYSTIMISFAASSPRWATRNTVRMFLSYPFTQLQVHKLRAAIAHSNERSLKLTQGVGFTREGTLADEFGKGIHAVMFRMYEKDFFRMYGNEQGKRLAA